MECADYAARGGGNTPREKESFRILSLFGYCFPVIVHFATQDTADLLAGKPIKRVAMEIQEHAFRKLRLLDNAISIASLQAVPSLRCKKLGGQRKGQPELWSIRINDQYRITFTCHEPPLEVRNAMFTDYH
jgi:plasmid maintenance system killer protein